jgi:RHS repeat-associated protein
VTATASAIGNPYLYTGQRWAPETENHYYKNRYQRPSLGRFISRDSQGYVDGMNEYEYVRSHPNWYLDPVGLAAWQATEGAYKDQDAKKRKAMRTKMKTCIVEKAKDALENKEKSDCADTAIKSIIECAKKLGYPLQFKVWDAAKKEYKYISYKDYDSSGDFVKDAQAQMTATSLMDNTRPQKWSDLEGGDFMLYKLEGEQHQDYTGHTMIITGKNTDADKPTWTTVEGHMQGNPPTAGAYTKAQFESKWDGPYEGRGRFLNWRDTIK